MAKWFEQIEQSPSNMISSRVRLVRSIDRYPFPKTMSGEQGAELVKKLKFGLQDLKELDGKEYEYHCLKDMDETEQNALSERRVLNSGILARKEAAGLFMAKDESSSIILNGEDHLRMQFLSTGLHLDGLWKQADAMDDYVNARFPYAFDDKYGYLTSFPTNIGTGLRASVTIHLPTLSMGKRFPDLVGDMSRFGITIRSIFSGGSENYGALYEVSNQKTFGLSEQEIIDLVTKVAKQLNNQENQVRRMALENHRLERTDEAYKSYGVVKYARRLSEREAMIFLSQLLVGTEDKLIKLKKPFSVYPLMLGIQKANLQAYVSKPLGKEEIDIARAEYLRENLPEID